MLSAIFVDRPRLAIVIAIVTTIAGALALYVDPDRPISRHRSAAGLGHHQLIPARQPPSSTRPIAQPIEAQVVGVDKMIYMKSVSGDDGSYTLTASFELGTNPDINTVNVNNRVQIALVEPAARSADARASRSRRNRRRCSASSRVYSPKHTHDPLFISNYVTINLLDQIKSTPGVGDATLWGPQDYAMRAWVRTDRLTGLGLTTGDIINAIQSQNVQAAVGRIGARPISNDQQLQLNIQTKGRLTQRCRVREHRHAHQSGRIGAAPGRRRPPGTGRRQSRPRDAIQRRTGGAVAIYQTPGRQRDRHAQGRPRPHRRA